MRKINRIYVHESDSKYGNALLISWWHSLRGWGVKAISHKEKPFILTSGYHYLIENGFPYSTKEKYDFLDGSISMLRNPKYRGAGVYGDNRASIHICLIKDTDQKQTDKQNDSLIRICLYLLKKYNLKVSDIYGHSEYYWKVKKPPMKKEDVPKTCPDVNMNQLRSDVNTYFKLIGSK